MHPMKKIRKFEFFLKEKRPRFKLLTANFYIFFGYYRGVIKYTTSVKFNTKLFKYRK